MYKQLERKNKQFNGHCDIDLDDEFIDKHNESQCCDNLLPSDDYINNSSTPE